MVLKGKQVTHVHWLVSVLQTSIAAFADTRPLSVTHMWRSNNTGLQQLSSPARSHGRQTDSSCVRPAGRISAGREHGRSSPAGKRRSDPSCRWSLWEPCTFLEGESWGRGLKIRIKQFLCSSDRNVDNDTATELLTSSFVKYLRVKSFRDKRKILLRNCLLSLPFFISVDSNRSGSDTLNK